MNNLNPCILESFYQSIASAQNPSESVYFQGVKYDVGSPELRIALNDWHLEKGIKHETRSGVHNES